MRRPVAATSSAPGVISPPLPHCGTCGSDGSGCRDWGGVCDGRCAAFSRSVAFRRNCGSRIRRCGPYRDRHLKVVARACFRTVPCGCRGPAGSLEPDTSARDFSAPTFRADSCSARRGAAAGWNLAGVASSAANAGQPVSRDNYAVDDRFVVGVRRRVGGDSLGRPCGRAGRDSPRATTGGLACCYDDPAETTVRISVETVQTPPALWWFIPSGLPLVVTIDVNRAVDPANQNSYPKLRRYTPGTLPDWLFRRLARVEIISTTQTDIRVPPEGEGFFNRGCI